MNSQTPNPFSPINIEAIAFHGDREEGGILKKQTDRVTRPLSQILQKPNTWPQAKPVQTTTNNITELASPRQLLFEDSVVQFQSKRKQPMKRVLTDPLVGHRDLRDINMGQHNLSDDSDFGGDQSRISNFAPNNPIRQNAENRLLRK